MARRRAKDPLIGHFDSFQMHPSNPRTYASGGQNLAALRTTAGQNLAAVGSSHSLAETVNHGTVTLAGLVGTLHLRYTSCQNTICSTAFRPQQHKFRPILRSYPFIITEERGLVNLFFVLPSVNFQIRAGKGFIQLGKDAIVFFRPRLVGGRLEIIPFGDGADAGGSVVPI